MMYKFRCHDCQCYIILSVTVDNVNLIAIYVTYLYNNVVLVMYIFKALNETKNILTLSRLSDPIY
jgi:hypothetical protein